MILGQKNHHMDIGKMTLLMIILEHCCIFIMEKVRLQRKKWKKEDWFKLAYIPEDLNKELRITITVEEAQYLRELLHNIDNRILKSLHDKVSHVLFQISKVSDEPYKRNSKSNNIYW